MSSTGVDPGELVSQLVAIDSVNPALVPGGAGEAEIAAFVARWLGRAGLDVEIVESTPGRPSVIARARGRSGGRTLMLNGHLDTVGVAGMERPHEPHIEGSRLYGRGACDMKGSLAACMIAGAAATREGLAGDLLITAVADEEHASLGARELAEHVHADAAIVTEPHGTDQICVGHGGFAWFEIVTRGRAAHGSRPALGVDAIVHAGAVLGQLEKLSRELSERPHPLLGPGSVHASLIEGGQELSSYPARCALQIERRTLPGDTETGVEQELRELIQRAAAGQAGFDADVRTILWRDPFEVDPDAEIVTTLRDAVRDATGREPKDVGSPAWMDAAIFSAAGIPTTVFGPGGEGAHAEVEWVNLDDVALCAEIYLTVARRVCA